MTTQQQQHEKRVLRVLKHWPEQHKDSYEYYALYTQLEAEIKDRIRIGDHWGHDEEVIAAASTLYQVPWDRELQAQLDGIADPEEFLAYCRANGG